MDQFVWSESEDEDAEVFQINEICYNFHHRRTGGDFKVFNFQSENSDLDFDTYRWEGEHQLYHLCIFMSAGAKTIGQTS